MPDRVEPELRRRGWFAATLDFVERMGNRLPDQITIFVGLAALTLVISAWAASAGFTVLHPATGKQIVVFSLLSRDGLQWVFSHVVENFTGFKPLGVVLVAVIGIGVAEKTGLFTALLKALLAVVPRWALTPAVLFAGILSHTASDAGYIILPPLAAMLYVSVGRHPMAGITTAFAGVAAGFSANVLISTLDPLLAGITEDAAHVVDPSYRVYATANTYFMNASSIYLTLIGWYVSVRIVEPRFGRWEGGTSALPDSTTKLGELEPLEWRGLAVAGIVLMLTAAGIFWLVLPDDGVLRNKDATGIASFTPFFDSIITLLLLVFLLPGLAYGIVTRRIRSDRDAANLMSDMIASMGRYIVMAFFAGQFIKWFDKSGLGLILAVEGAELLKALHFTGIPLMIGFIVVTSIFELLMSSASAKWMVMGPIFVPMFMLLGVSPETTQALYRIGDSVTNVVNPVNVYFPIILAAAHRYVPSAGMGTILAAMVPYSVVFLIAWTVLIVIWMLAGIPLGPGAPLTYSPG